MFGIGHVDQGARIVSVVAPVGIGKHARAGVLSQNEIKRRVKHDEKFF